MPDVLKQKPFFKNDGLLLGCGIWMWADVAAHHVIRQHLILPRLVRMVWQHEATDSGDSFMKPRISATNAGFILWKMFLAKKYASIASLLFYISFLKILMSTPAKPWTSSHQAASTNYNYNQVLLRTHCIYGAFVQVPVFASIICTPFSSIFCKRRGFMRTPAPKQHSPRPQHQSLAAMPILQRIWLISKHAHEVKATENRIREIHILWEGPAFCGLPFNGFGGDFSRIAGMQCKFSLSFLWEHIMT